MPGGRAAASKCQRVGVWCVGLPVVGEGMSRAAASKVAYVEPWKVGEIGEGSEGDSLTATVGSPRAQE